MPARSAGEAEHVLFLGIVELAANSVAICGEGGNIVHNLNGAVLLYSSGSGAHIHLVRIGDEIQSIRYDLTCANTSSQFLLGTLQEFNHSHINHSSYLR